MKLKNKRCPLPDVKTMCSHHHPETSFTKASQSSQPIAKITPLKTNSWNLKILPFLQRKIIIQTSNLLATQTYEFSRGYLHKYTSMTLPSLKRAAKAPENRPSFKGNNRIRIPTIHFQVVSGRVQGGPKKTVLNGVLGPL